MSRGAASDAKRPEAAVERSLDLAGSTLKARYRLDALRSVTRDLAVYAAEDLRHRRPIALKVLRGEVAADAAFCASVREQAATLAMFAHLHRSVARVYECDTTETGDLFVAVERTEGATLRDLLSARGAFDPVTALRIATRIGEALEALHHNGIIHGELDPDAVFMVPADGGPERVTLAGVELTAAYRTPIGLRVRGTAHPGYRAPEQVDGGETTPSADVYALGMLLRELLTAPTAPEPAGVETPPPVIPAAIERIIATALDSQPARRYADISVMLNDLWGAHARLGEPEARRRSGKRPPPGRRRPHQRRRRGRLRIAAAVVTAAAAATVWLAAGDRIVSRFRARAAAPTTPAGAADPLPPPPISASQPLPAEPPRAPAPEAAAAVKETPPPAEPAPAPVTRRPAPSVTRPARAEAPVVRGEPRRPLVPPPAPAPSPAQDRSPAGEADDGSAVVDWLLQNRR